MGGGGQASVASRAEGRVPCPPEEATVLPWLFSPPQRQCELCACSCGGSRPALAAGTRECSVWREGPDPAAAPSLAARGPGKTWSFSDPPPPARFSGGPRVPLSAPRSPAGWGCSTCCRDPSPPPPAYFPPGDVTAGAGLGLPPPLYCHRRFRLRTARHASRRGAPSGARTLWSLPQRSHAQSRLANQRREPGRK